MSTLKNIISYHKDCFEEENKGGGIWNFFTTKVEHRYLIPNIEEHITGFLPYTPILNKNADALSNEIAYYKKEKEIIFRKSEELGVPLDECQMILDSLVYEAKAAKENKIGNWDAKSDRLSQVNEQLVQNKCK